MKALCVSLMVVAIACGDSSGPGPQAASVTGIAGDNQSASRGTSLPFPLTFTTLGSNGQPIQGVSVSWSVTPSGAATFSAPTSQTDVNGVAATNVTVGSTLGSLTIQASVTGVSPVVYHATVLDPCLVETTHNVGETANGALTTSDCNINNYYYDFYRLGLPAGQHNLRISMRSTTFDTWLDVYTLTDSVIGFDDDSVLLQAQNAQFDAVFPGNTTYIIGANSFDNLTVGQYTLQTATRPAPMNGCRAVWLVRGVTLSDSITNSDCADSAATPHRYDVARIAVYNGTVLTISQRSTTFNPSLALYLLNPNTYARTLVASNDDSLAGTNTNAFIQYAVNVAAEGAYYDIIIGTSAGGETGAYTFEVSPSTTLSPRISAPLSRGRDGWWRDVAVPRRSKR